MLLKPREMILEYFSLLPSVTDFGAAFGLLS